MWIKKFSVLLCLSACLSACDRHDYVTWHCKKDPANSEEKPLRIILEGSTMKLPDQNYQYCGSLGTDSYFDTQCSKETSESAIRFTPKTGAWSRGSENLSCTPL
jgi:hypothetical protein